MTRLLGCNTDISVYLMASSSWLVDILAEEETPPYPMSGRAFDSFGIGVRPAVYPRCRLLIILIRITPAAERLPTTGTMGTAPGGREQRTGLGGGGWAQGTAEWQMKGIPKLSAY